MKQTKTAYIFKFSFLATFVLIQFFGFGLTQQVLAATSCTIDSPIWADTNNKPISAIVVGQTYHVIATWHNCERFTGYFLLKGPPYNTSDSQVGIGNLTKTDDPHWAAIAITQPGAYSFSAWITAGLTTTAPAYSDVMNTDGSQLPPGADGSGSGQQTVVSQKPNPEDKLYNPLGSSQQNLTDFLIVILKGFLGIIAIWAVTFIVIGGFKMVISQGNEEAVTSAKKTITWAILGLVVALLSFSVIIIIQNLIGVEVKPPTTISPGGTPNDIPGGTPNDIPGGTTN